MTVPNLLTILRILLTPLLIHFLHENRLKEALVLFFVAGLSDGLDGLIARLFHQKSKLGAYLDPLADKLLLVSSFIMLATLGLVPVWLVILTVSRDITILAGLAALMLRQIPVKIKPSALSKANTLMQLFTVLSAMGSVVVRLPSWVYSFFFCATALLTIGSGVQYVRAGMALAEEAKAEEKKRRSA
jgi:cardiolipin synthase (CMP-forming)